MNSPSDKINRNIIEILDSDDQRQQEKKNQAKRTVDVVTSQIKSKTSHFSNLEKNKQWSNHSATPLQKPIKNKPQFQDIYAFKDIWMTNNLNDHLAKLRNFIQYSQKNVLFIFGPSGCGKTIMTLSTLNQNGIDYELVQERVEQNDYGEYIYEDNIDMLYRIFSLRSRIREKIYISKDFPVSVDEMSSNYSIKYKYFKQNLFDLISNISNRNKYIFILNSQIYSSYYLLNQSSESKGIHQLKNVSVIKIEPYGPRDMKKIIDHFISCNPSYSTVTNHSKTMDQIITEANGDVRKALNIIYFKKIRQFGRLNPNKNFTNQKKIRFQGDNDKQAYPTSSKKSQLGTFGRFPIQPHDEQQKQQQKVGIFHALGKLLYGKRYNISYNPHDKKNKKTNNISRYYTEEDIDRLNPKFYFKPVELLEKAHLNINICAEYFLMIYSLLQENFLSRYGKLKDIVKMYGIFRYYDSYLEDSLNKFEVKEQMQQHLKELLTWGIIVYNKNTVRDNSFLSIQRSKNNINQKIIKKKNELIKIYYLRYKDSVTTFKYNRKDIIQLAYLLKTNNQKTYSTYGVFLQSLINIIFDNGRRVGMNGAVVDKQTNVIEDDQEDLANQNCNKLNKITDTLNLQLRKKEKLIEMMIEDSNESDIDSD